MKERLRKLKWVFVYFFFIHQEFRKMSFSGYILNGEQDNFFYMSLSRNHPQRIGTITGVPRSDSRQEVMHIKETESQATKEENDVRNVLCITSCHSCCKQPGLFFFLIPAFHSELELLQTSLCHYNVVMRTTPPA